MEYLESELKKDPTATHVSGGNFDIGFMELREDNTYRAECDKGHVTLTALQEQRFQLLFEVGAQAIADGYYRDAVASFTSSLERFYEFFIRVCCYQKEFTDDEISELWKPISNSSVMQEGAFIYSYFEQFRTIPPTLPNKKKEFRNSVIHKGMLPTREQALDYGEKIIDLMWPTVQKTKEQMERGVRQTVRAHLSGPAITAYNEGLILGTFSRATLITLNPCSSERPSLAGAVAIYTNRPGHRIRW